jgi:hypothetical protein
MGNILSNLGDFNMAGEYPVRMSLGPWAADFLGGCLVMPSYISLVVQSPPSLFSQRHRHLAGCHCRPYALNPLVLPCLDLSLTGVCTARRHAYGCGHPAAGVPGPLRPCVRVANFSVFVCVSPTFLFRVGTAIYSVAGPPLQLWVSTDAPSAATHTCDFPRM